MPPELEALIRRQGIGEQSHNGKTLLDHLEGTGKILIEMRQPERVVLAGYAHSIYGTEFYNVGAPPTREEVRAAIGEEAEWLAYLFCKLRRWSINSEVSQFQSGMRVRLSTQTFIDLKMIAQANRKEQKSYVR